MDESPRTNTLQTLSVPIAIVVAGALIAVAIYFVSSPAAAPSPTDTTASEVVPVSASDHILGDPNAPIKVIEYSDLDCPFCKAFHITMQQIMKDYGSTGQVAWVYRHFPLQQLHPNAPKLAEASECVAELGGNDAFWKFVGDVFASAPGNEHFDMTKLTATAVGVGINGTQFDTCVTSGRHQALITKEFNDAIASGGQGTPHNIIVTASGQTIPIPGAQSYATVKSVIETLINGSAN